MSIEAIENLSSSMKIAQEWGNREIDGISGVVELQSDVEGPTVVIVAGIHGDEGGGIRTIESLSQELAGNFRGKILFIIGNLAASQKGEKFAEDGKDFNRLWEQGTMDARVNKLCELIVGYQPDVVCDLHETTLASSSMLLPVNTDDTEWADVPMVINDLIDRVHGTMCGRVSQLLPEAEIFAIEGGKRNTDESCRMLRNNVLRLLAHHNMIGISGDEMKENKTTQLTVQKVLTSGGERGGTFVYSPEPRGFDIIGPHRAIFVTHGGEVIYGNDSGDTRVVMPVLFSRYPGENQGYLATTGEMSIEESSKEYFGSTYGVSEGNRYIDGTVDPCYFFQEMICDYNSIHDSGTKKVLVSPYITFFERSPIAMIQNYESLADKNGFQIHFYQNPNVSGEYYFHIWKKSTADSSHPIAA